MTLMQELSSPLTKVRFGSCWLAACSNPPVICIYGRLFKARVVEPICHFLFRVAVFDRSRKAIELIVYANTKRKLSVLLHRNFFRGLRTPGYCLQQPIGPHKESKRCDRRGKCKTISD